MDVGGGSGRQRVQQGKPCVCVWGCRLEKGKRKEQRGEVKGGRGGRFVLGKRDWIFTGERGLFYMSAPADSCRQEFRSSFCHRAYTLDHLWWKHASLQLLPDTSAPQHTHSCLCADLLHRNSGTRHAEFCSLSSDTVDFLHFPYCQLSLNLHPNALWSPVVTR